jgi:hypothetical protein
MQCQAGVKWEMVVLCLSLVRVVIGTYLGLELEPELSCLQTMCCVNHFQSD